jgi:uncharacterized protein YcgI (DUF1989 family)
MDHEIAAQETLFAGEGRAYPLKAGQRLRVINTNGGQVVDMWAVLPSRDEHLSMAHTRIHMSRLVPRVGDALWSNHRRKLLHLVEDTSPGVHDMLLAACDDARYRLLGHRSYHRNCSDNFRQALRTLGIRREKVPDPLNLFQNTPWHVDGELGYEASRASAGDYVTLEAAVDLVVVLSACPMDLNPINGYDVRDVGVQRLGPRPDGSGARADRVSIATSDGAGAPA